MSVNIIAARKLEGTKRIVSDDSAKRLAKKGIPIFKDKEGQKYWVPRHGEGTLCHAQQVQHADPSTVNPSAMQVWLRSL